VSRLHPVTFAGSGPVIELLGRLRYVRGVLLGHWGSGPPRPQLEMRSEVNVAPEAHVGGSAAPEKFAPATAIVVLIRLLQESGSGPVIGVLAIEIDRRLVKFDHSLGRGDVI
jgi:hypothetical protein